MRIAYYSNICLSIGSFRNFILELVLFFKQYPGDGVKFPHFMILTQYAAPNIMFIHNKMPVIFDSSNAGLLRKWLDPNAAPPWDVERIIENSVTETVYEKKPCIASYERSAAGV